MLHFCFRACPQDKICFLGGGGGVGNESIAIILSCSLSFLFLSFPAIFSFFGTLSIIFLSHGILAAITFQKKRKFYLQKRSR